MGSRQIWDWIILFDLHFFITVYCLSIHTIVNNHLLVDIKLMFPKMSEQLSYIIIIIKYNLTPWYGSTAHSQRSSHETFVRLINGQPNTIKYKSLGCHDCCSWRIQEVTM